MPRIRTIKPGFFANEGLSEVSESAQILAAGLLCYADDEGYFNAHPGLVKAAVFPLRTSVTNQHIEQMFNELTSIGYVSLGNTSDGRRWGHVVTFLDHQKVSHPVASKIKTLQIIWDSHIEPSEPVRPSKYVYLVKAGEFYKIGIADDINERVKRLQSGCPHKIEIINSWNVSSASRHESYLHNSFSMKCTSGEWFSLSSDDILFVNNYMGTVSEPSRNPHGTLLPELNRTEKELKRKRNKEEEIKPSAKQVRGANSPELVLPTDSRHIRIKSLICNAYEQNNNIQCPWDGSEGKQLKAFLDATPAWIDSQVAQCLVNMYDSAGFAKGTRPREFLPRLPRYLHGPLNEFNREQSNGNGQTRPTSKANDREQRIVERALKYRTVAAGATDSAGAGPVAIPGNGRSGISGLEREPEIIPPRKDSSGIRPDYAPAAKD